jgi:hypothetical protein
MPNLTWQRGSKDEERLESKKPANIGTAVTAIEVTHHQLHRSARNMYNTHISQNPNNTVDELVPLLAT